jgi:UDP-N-acetylmuramoylalanine--D-glutamate ligase
MPEALDINGKRVLVVGLGKSGVASALFLQERGARVTVSDSKSEDQLAGEIPQLLDKGITVETGRHGERTFRDQDLIVVSPGVPVDVPQLTLARELHIPVIGEIELASRFLRGPIVAITGSNGKTTTTALTGSVIARGGHEVQVGGNIGTPAIALVPASTDDTYNVLEISSFQLETIVTFRPQVAVVLNVTPDHLDRHRSMELYAAAKARIFENQTAADYAVLNADDPICRKMAQEREIMPVTGMQLKGAHNLENVLAAVAVGMITGCEPEQIRRAVAEFKAVEHRLEYVATINGVQYFNDSKATNVDATIKALESFAANVHLVLGGKDKGSDYSVLRPLLRERVKAVYTIGAAAEKIQSQIAGAAPVTSAGSLDVAVRRAAEAAAPGDIVLLAPACASFDQFTSYEHRGQVFKDLVRALEARQQKLAAQ